MQNQGSKKEEAHVSTTVVAGLTIASIILLLFFSEPTKLFFAGMFFSNFLLIVSLVAKNVRLRIEEPKSTMVG